MDCLQRSDADLGVNLGGRQFGVTEHRLDVPDVRPALQHDRGQGVPEQVTGAFFGDPGGFDVLAHQLRQTVEAERCAVDGEEQRPVIRLGSELGSGVGQVRVQPGS